MNIINSREDFVTIALSRLSGTLPQERKNKVDMIMPTLFFGLLLGFTQPTSSPAFPAPSPKRGKIKSA